MTEDEKCEKLVELMADIMYVFNTPTEEEMQEHNEWNGYYSSAKLTRDQVIEIRRAHAAGEASYQKLAIKYDVSRETIKNAVRRFTFKDVA